MRRVLVTLGLVGLVAGATGCGSGAVQEPETPAKGFTQTQAPRRQERQQQPRLIAPPPAYGNKVVMARGTSSTALN